MQLVFVEEERQEPFTLSSIVAECAETKHETVGEFVKKLNYCFENNKLSIPYLMVSLENNTVTSNRGLLNQLEMLEKYLN